MLLIMLVICAFQTPSIWLSWCYSSSGNHTSLWFPSTSIYLVQHSWPVNETGETALLQNWTLNLAGNDDTCHLVLPPSSLVCTYNIHQWLPMDLTSPPNRWVMCLPRPISLCSFFVHSLMQTLCRPSFPSHRCQHSSNNCWRQILSGVSCVVNDGRQSGDSALVGRRLLLIMPFGIVTSRAK